MQEQLASTNSRLSIIGHFFKQLLTVFLFYRRFFLTKLFEFRQVLLRVEGKTLTLSSVSASPARLLVIFLYALGYIIMDDIPHIGFINTHAKSNRGHYDLHPFHQEVILIVRTGDRIHTCMIGQGTDAIYPQRLGKLIHLLAAETIHDARLAWLRLDKLDDFSVYVLRLGPNLIIEVWTIERGLEELGIIHLQYFLDILLHFQSSRGCQRNHAHFLPYLLNNWTYFPIFWPEVMSPLR